MTDRAVMLVTGGTGSVGSAVAREAAQQGWALVVHGGTRAKVDALVAQLRKTALAQGIAADVHEAGAAERLVAQAGAAFGRLDAVVDCVATGPSGARLTGLFKDTDPQHYGAFYELSAAWFQRLAHAAYPQLACQGGTLIAFISDAGKFADRKSVV